MAHDATPSAREVTRITLVAHHRLSEEIVGLLPSLGLRTAYVENARCVRQRMNTRIWGLPGLRAELSDAATEVYRMTVSRETAVGLLCRIVDELDLRTPGRGAAYAQDLLEISPQDLPEAPSGPGDCDPLPLKLSLITGIQSKSVTGEKLFRIALRLGVGVPVVAHGIGTGIRDRLGLLRITIAPEKELAYLMVPAQDADGLQRLLIDEAHLDRPGGGFLYQTPIRAGTVDPLIRIGLQEHAASIEQIVAAIDDLKRGTAWRKRFFGVEAAAGSRSRPGTTHREISFFCHDGQGDGLVQAAMEAGAEGATVSRVRLLGLRDDVQGRSIAFEHGILCVSAAVEAPVLEALCTVAGAGPDRDWAVQSLVARAVFSHQRT